MPNRNCPICDCNENSLLKEIDLKTYDNHPLDNNYELVECNACGFIFYNTNINQEILDEYYTNQSKYESKDVVSVGAGGITELDKVRLIDTAKIISDYVPDYNLSILDVGCASGGLIDSLSGMGYVNLTGLDPSSICIERVAKMHKCKTILGSILDTSLVIGNKFDVIILTHVLEHILDVKKLLIKLYDLLNENGIIYIECPDKSKYHVHVHAPFQEFNTEHINHFSETSFQNLSSTMRIDLIGSGSRTFKIENGKDYYACYGVFKKSNKLGGQIKKETSEKDVYKYILESSRQFNQILKFINNVKYKNIVLYGIGQFAYKIIKVIDRSKNIIYVDGDSRNQHKTIFGNKIFSPEELPILCNDNTCIIITSLISSDSIKRNINNIFYISNITIPEVLTLNIIDNEVVN
jgi:2-polyprenyl-3-methyl-5-hydroxy-6-metoxy-1,4-benzoquinol methylase